MIAGAFGSHGLRKVLTVEKLQAWQTASQYAVRSAIDRYTANDNLLTISQIFNGLGLLAISIHPRFAAHRFAGPAVAVGGLVFSGSVMGLVLDNQQR